MNFDPVARSYCWLERFAFGRALQRCRIAHMDWVARSKNVLILGEGDGRFLEAFLRRNPMAKVTVVDSSRRMIELARKRVEDSKRVTFLLGDARSLEFRDHQFDLIVTHFFLDCFAEADVLELVGKLRSRLAGKGRWLWSDFAVPSHGWTRWAAQIIVWALYQFFRLSARVEAKRLVDVKMIFKQVGLEPRVERSFLSGLLLSELWEPVAD